MGVPYTRKNWEQKRNSSHIFLVVVDMACICFRVNSGIESSFSEIPVLANFLLLGSVFEFRVKYARTFSKENEVLAFV